MAGDAELSFRVLHHRAQRDRAPPRRVRQPTVAHIYQEIHPRTHSQVRIEIRRNRILICMKLERGVIGGHAHVVFLPRLKNAGAELVEAGIILGCLNLIDKLTGSEWNHIRLSGRVLAQLKNIHVQRNIAVRDVEDEVNQARLLFAESELEPLKTLEHGSIAVFVFRWRIGPLVVAAKDGLAKLELLSALPGIVGRSRNETALHSIGLAWKSSRWLQDLAQGCADLRFVASERG